MEAQKDFLWVYGIIDGSENRFHYECCDNLIELFGIKYPDEKDKKLILIDLLSDKRQPKKYESRRTIRNIPNSI